VHALIGLVGSESYSAIDDIRIAYYLNRFNSETERASLDPNVVFEMPGEWRLAESAIIIVHYTMVKLELLPGHEAVNAFESPAV